ncbi:MAG: hypothetical protein WCI97_06245 [Bacteroidota bacterium]
MKKLASGNGETGAEKNSSFIVEPTIEALQKQRSYHITQVEWHQCEITGLEVQIRKYKQEKENEIVGDHFQTDFSTTEMAALQSGINK